eukprot:GHRQ01024997.1.p2 GENE.GHRQ01024997.1~~GHRQ01024997.1.p2  ORF type:complete len:146 (-),score=27.12 GHRQ01024997.1:527-964(-)
MCAHLMRHAALQLHSFIAANVLKKPLIIEEFGLTWFKKTLDQQRVLFKVWSGPAQPLVLNHMSLLFSTRPALQCVLSCPAVAALPTPALRNLFLPCTAYPYVTMLRHWSAASHFVVATRADGAHQAAPEGVVFGVSCSWLIQPGL